MLSSTVIRGINAFGSASSSDDSGSRSEKVRSNKSNDRSIRDNICSTIRSDTAAHSSSSSNSTTASSSARSKSIERKEVDNDTKMTTWLYETKKSADDKKDAQNGSFTVQPTRKNRLNQRMDQKRCDNADVLEDEAPLSLGATAISKDEANNQKLDASQSNTIDTDIETQTAKAAEILHFTQLSDGSNELYPPHHEQLTASMGHIPPLLPSENLEGNIVPPGEIVRRKLRKFMATVVIAFVIVAAFVIILESSQTKQKEASSNSDTTPTGKFDQNKVAPLSPTKDFSLVGIPNGYDFQSCDSWGLDVTDFCAVGNCFSGPHCSCEVYVPQEESDVIEFCNYCSICDFDGNIAYNCNNLGLGEQLCPSRSSQQVEDSPQAKDEIVYSPPYRFKERFCNPGLDPRTELCFAGECTNDERCQCDIYSREVASGYIFGICNSCDVCSDGAIASDCTNLGLDQVGCKSSTEQTYSPSDNYQDRFCVTGFIDPSAGLCFAGECTNDEICQCDMYKRDLVTEDVIGLCDSCSICADGGISHDCTNLNSPKVACRNYGNYTVSNHQTSVDDSAGDKESVETPPIIDNVSFCVQSFDPSSELCFSGECTNDESCLCEMYKRDIETEDVIGLCNSCSICDDGGISHDCRNVGSTKVTCRDYDSYIKSAEQIEVSIPQLSQGKPSDANASVEDTGSDVSSLETFYTENDYRCSDPSNGVQLCQAQSCDKPGCSCDAYFRDILTQQPVGTCAACSVCDNGTIGLVCMIYGIEMDLSC